MNIPEEYKICSVCKKSQPFSSFPKDKRSKDGLKARCKSCSNADRKRDREKNKVKNSQLDPFENPEPKRCPACSRELPRTSFYRKDSNTDGLRTNCIDCTKEEAANKQTRNSEKNKDIDPYQIEGVKVCTDCGLEKPRTEFHIRRASIDGLSVTCKKCNVQKSVAYQKKHPEKKKEHDRKYRQSHPDEIRRHGHNRRARELDLSRGEILTIGEFREIHGDLCFFCQQVMDFENCFIDGEVNPLYVTLEHLVPLKYGGLHTNLNLALSCQRCNSSKNAKSLEEYLDTLENPSQQALILADALYHQPNLLDHFMDLSYHPEAIKRFEVYSL